MGLRRFDISLADMRGGAEVPFILLGLLSNSRSKTTEQTTENAFVLAVGLEMWEAAQGRVACVLMPLLSLGLNYF